MKSYIVIGQKVFMSAPMDFTQRASAQLLRLFIPNIWQLSRRQDSRSIRPCARPTETLNFIQRRTPDT